MSEPDGTSPSSDDEADPATPAPIAPTDSEWLTFEKDVTKLLVSKDPTATVEHNHKRTGKSGRKRQIDTLVTGTVCDELMEIAVEAKHYSAKVGIGVIDAFVGKCLDTGVERGVLYSHKGFDAGAFARAAVADHPKIMLRTLPDATSADSSLHVELVPWEQVLPEFLDYKSCPGDHCPGEVLLRHDLGWDGGVCDQCALPSGECNSCEEFQRLESDSEECCSCAWGLFTVRRDSDTHEVTDIQWIKGIFDH